MSPPLPTIARCVAKRILQAVFLAVMIYAVVVYAPGTLFEYPEPNIAAALVIFFVGLMGFIAASSIPVKR